MKPAALIFAPVVAVVGSTLAIPAPALAATPLMAGSVSASAVVAAGSLVAQAVQAPQATAAPAVRRSAETTARRRVVSTVSPGTDHRRHVRTLRAGYVSARVVFPSSCSYLRVTISSRGRLLAAGSGNASFALSGRLARAGRVAIAVAGGQNCRAQYRLDLAVSKKPVTPTLTVRAGKPTVTKALTRVIKAGRTVTVPVRVARGAMTAVTRFSSRCGAASVRLVQRGRVLAAGVGGNGLAVAGAAGAGVVKVRVTGSRCRTAFRLDVAMPDSSTPSFARQPSTSSHHTPAPNPAPSPTPPPTPLPDTDRIASTAGSLPVGAASYAVPSGAVVVAPSGSDSAAGTLAEPFATVARAISAAPSGATVVLRAGTYHESVTIPTGKSLAVQAYPGEAVWFDGSVPVSGFVADGDAFRRDGWMPVFDHSPTYTPGAPDNTTPGWSFVNAAYPMAAYPDQVWIDGVAQAQVGSLSAVAPGKFWVDTTNHRLYLGTDPAGRAVRASDLGVAIKVSGAASSLRGFGVRRYATSVPQKGAILLVAARSSIENVVISDNATQGMYLGGRDLGSSITVRSVTAERNGLLGIESSYADGLVFDRVRAVNNNTEHFNSSPVSGGFKITRSRVISITNSVFASNLGPGLWLDESVYSSKVIGNDMVGNSGHGMSLEISAKSVIANNLVTDNGGNGFKINNSSNVDMWNNTILRSGSRPVWLVQDSRVASNTSTPGHDPRQALPDPTVTWILGPVVFKNNIIAGTGSNCLLCGQDTALLRSGEQIGIQADGNVYGRASASAPTWVATWPSGVTNPFVYTTVSAFRNAKGQDAHSADIIGVVADSNGAPTDAVSAMDASVAQPLDATIASLTSRQTGARHIGAWLD